MKDVAEITPAAARKRFPRGLEQPAGGFRFAADALLLAAFAAECSCGRMLDLGAGCGVVGFGVLLRAGEKPLQVLGVDRDPQMVAAAHKNAEVLGFQEQYRAAKLDLRRRDAAWREQVPPGAFDLVTANPPYRETRAGRQNPDTNKAGARFENHATLEDFILAAKASCTTKGRFCLVYLAERLATLCHELQQHGFSPKRLLPVHSRVQEPARLVLLEARKQGGEGLELLPPLVLYEGQGEHTVMSRQALAFCPFFTCNARGREAESGCDTETTIRNND